VLKDTKNSISKAELIGDAGLSPPYDVGTSVDVKAVPPAGSCQGSGTPVVSQRDPHHQARDEGQVSSEAEHKPTRESSGSNKESRSDQPEKAMKKASGNQVLHLYWNGHMVGHIVNCPSSETGLIVAS
jgi:hypothetical protein